MKCRLSTKERNIVLIALQKLVSSRLLILVALTTLTASVAGDEVSGIIIPRDDDGMSSGHSSKSPESANSGPCYKTP